MIQLLHIRSAGRLSYVWSYLPQEKTIVAVFRSIPVHIPICSESVPRLGAYAISRRLEGWQVCPAKFYLDRGYWRTRFSPYADGITEEFLLLTGAGNLNEEMASLVQD